MGSGGDAAPAGGPHALARPLVLERAEVGGVSVEAFLRVTDRRWMRTSLHPGLADAVIDLLPGLLRHRCDSDSAHGMRQELADTETPHLLEHVALELMALSGSPRDLRGETVWEFAADGPGVFRVRIGFDDDLVALGALDRALALVNALLEGEVPESVDKQAAELQALRER